MKVEVSLEDIKCMTYALNDYKDKIMYSKGEFLVEGDSKTFYELQAIEDRCAVLINMLEGIKYEE